MSDRSIQMLEPRRLLSINHSGTSLSINGSDDSETIVVEISPSDSSKLRVSLDGTVRTFDLSSVRKLRINGASGDDVIRVGTAAQPLAIPATLNGGEGSDQIYSSARNSIRLRVSGESGNDRIELSGNSRDYIYAGEGNDTVQSGSGNDTIQAGSGNDEVNAGPGADRLYGAEGDDLLQGGSAGPSGAPAKDLIDAGEGNDTAFGGNGNDTIRGGEGDDELHGGTDRDDIRGGEGSDLIYGNAGHDTLLGNGASDEIFGGTGIDRFADDERDDEVRDFETNIDRIL